MLRALEIIIKSRAIYVPPLYNATVLRQLRGTYGGAVSIVLLERNNNRKAPQPVASEPHSLRLLATAYCLLGWGGRLRRALRRTDPDRLHVDELADTEGRQLAPIAAVLHAAEGQARVRRGHPVDKDRARFDAAGQRLSALGGARPQGAAPAQLGGGGRGPGPPRLAPAGHPRGGAGGRPAGGPPPRP